MKACVNVAERFPQSRIGWEANGVTKPPTPADEWPWLMEIRCRHGLVYPWGGKLLQAFSNRPGVRMKLRRLPCVLEAQGDEEVVVRFHVDDAAQVFALLKPYRRRQVSESERARLGVLGVATRFGKGERCGSESAFPALESTQRRRVRGRVGSIEENRDEGR